MPKIRFDVMVMEKGDARYVCTMEMPYNPCFPIPQEEWREYVVSRRPSLAHRDFRIIL